MRSPIFIIGSPRSGTTLLRLMLTCHRNIVVPPECSFGLWLYDKYSDWTAADVENRTGLFLADLMKCRKFETWNLAEDVLSEVIRHRGPTCYAGLVSAIYESYGLSRGRQFTRWGDKNNSYIRDILPLNSLFPQAQFIHIVRDGRSVACSYKALKRRDLPSRYAPQLFSSIEEVAQRWQDNLKSVRQSFDSLGWDHVREIRFEDLLCDPHGQLVRLCEYLDERYDPSMLDYPQTNRDEALEPSEFLPWKQKTLHPPLESEVDRYVRELSAEEIVLFQRHATEMLTIYGYLNA